jgi:O-antigen ligase
MLNIPLIYIKNFYLRNKLKSLELAFLSFFLVFLPAFEAPKNIFLAGYLITALYRQSQLISSKWNIWDWIFLSLIISSFLSSLFPFETGGSEWKGFRGLMFWIIFGWTLSRSDYNYSEKKYLFFIAITATLFPLGWGLLQFLILNTKGALELHSVGHVNHSAIYLCMIFGGLISILLNYLYFEKKNNFYLKFFLGLFILFYLFCINLTLSRGVFGVSLLLAFALFGLSKASIKNKVILTMISLFLIGSFNFFKPMPIINEQLQEMNSNDIFGLGERKKVWNAALEISRLNPLFGIGNGNWKYIKMDKIRSEAESRGKSFNINEYALQYGHPHNIYLANLVDRGIFGLVIFLNFMLFWLIALVNSYKKFNRDSNNMLFVMGSFSAWVTIFVVGIVNTTFHHENALLALFFLGLHLSLFKKKKFFLN